MVVDDHKIDFITCVNNQDEYDEFLFYIQNLKVPEGFRFVCTAVRGASSMAQGYQWAMERSDAKYKVYMHQDVYIVYPGFMECMVQAFAQDPQLGILGVAGSIDYSPAAVWWIDTKTAGGVYQLSGDRVALNGWEKVEPSQELYREAVLLDGVLLATQHDIPWRADLFPYWHYYDLSQCCEFTRAGYKVGILNQNQREVFTPFCLHNKGESDYGPTWQFSQTVFYVQYHDLWT